MTPRALVIDDCAALLLGVVLAPVTLWRAVRRCASSVRASSVRGHR